MNCCNHNHKNDTHKKHSAKGPMSHMWMMALCCGAPLVLLGAVSLLGAGFPAVRAVLLNILPFVCPIMMVAMLPMMFMHGRHEEPAREETLPVEDRREP